MIRYTICSSVRFDFLRAASESCLMMMKTNLDMKMLKKYQGDPKFQMKSQFLLHGLRRASCITDDKTKEEIQRIR